MEMTAMSGVSFRDQVMPAGLTFMFHGSELSGHGRYEVCKAAKLLVNVKGCSARRFRAFTVAFRHRTQHDRLVRTSI